MKYVIAAALTMATCAAVAAPGRVSTLSFDPAQPKAGQEVRITVDVDGEPPSNCGLLVSFDDGSNSQFKIDGSQTKFPLTIGKVYAKPGSYSIKAEGRKVTSHFPCVGEVQKLLTVEPSEAAKAAPGAGAAVPAPNCPEGYKQKGKTGKAGEFSCTAGKGAQKPEKVIDCSDGLEYFQTKTTLGCRKERK